MWLLNTMPTSGMPMSSPSDSSKLGSWKKKLPSESRFNGKINLPWHQNGISNCEYILNLGLNMD
jgi:hypothetical protein